MTNDRTTETVRQRYAELATTAAHGDNCCTPSEQAVFGTSRYGTDDLDAVPATAAAASLGCGNPTAVADLAAGSGM
jgi:arsenite methyltransferase